MSIEVHPDWWKTLFDDVYLLTDARSVDDRELTRREVDVISRFLSLKPRHRILDLCGGHGRHSLELARRGFERCAVVDYSPFLVARGNATARVVEVQAWARARRLRPEGAARLVFAGDPQRPETLSWMVVQPVSDEGGRAKEGAGGEPRPGG